MTQTGNSKVEQIIAKLENDACDALHAVMGMLETIAQEPLTEAQWGYLRTCRSSMDRLLLSMENVAAFLDPASLSPASLGPTGDAAQSSCFNLREVIAELAGVMETSSGRNLATRDYEAHKGLYRYNIQSAEPLGALLAICR